MPIPEKYLADFNEGGYYHVYNRTNNKEKLFITDDNRRYFLKRYNEFISPFADTFCWNLLPNHFHFLIQVKPQAEIMGYLAGRQGLTSLTKTEKKFIQSKISLSQLIEQAFKRFFQSYALAFNKQQNREGNLFTRPFKRVEINKESHFTQTIVYIHANAQHHKLCRDFADHKWSSWHSIISDAPTNIKRKEVLEWFGGLKNLIAIHKSMGEYYYSDIEG